MGPCVMRGPFYLLTNLKQYYIICKIQGDRVEYSNYLLSLCDIIID